MKRGYENIFRFVSILFKCDFKCNYFFSMKEGHGNVWVYK